VSNDHAVPQMYLRRFGWQRKPSSREWFISARSVDDLDQPFTANVRRVAAVTDFYGERVEKLLSQVEGDAVPAFESMLDDPRGALSGPGSWPLPLDKPTGSRLPEFHHEPDRRDDQCEAEEHRDLR
jgi:hypothetical protein